MIVDIASLEQVSVLKKKLRVKAPTQGRQIGAILALEMLKVTYIQGCDDALGIFSS